MSNTYTGKSPRNARIKIDYTGESPSVKFNYPRKDGYVGSMFTEFMLLWVVLIYFGTVIVGTGFTFGYDQGINLNEESEKAPLLIPEEKAMVEYVEYKWYVWDWQLTITERLLTLGKAGLGVLLLSLILFGPPKLANRYLCKSLFPKYMAWKAKKKYVKFTKEDVKVQTINGKKLIYVEIPFFENVILNYHGKGDFSKYLDIIEIQEHNFKIKELSKGKKYKNKRNVKKQNEWYWWARFHFSKKPKEGELTVIFK